MMLAAMRVLFALSVWLAPAWAIWNPIISGFNPDPAILRVGDDYYIATSSFEYWPGIPIYHSKDLSNWTLVSHALTRPEQLQLYGVPTGAGAWAPSLTHFHGKFYLSGMTRWTYDPTARVWPRVWFISSPDLVSWSDPVWAEPWGIDPELFHDPATGRTYLNLMAPNNNKERLWGIAQCEVSVSSGKCVREGYKSLWNGTLERNATARPEGPKMFLRRGWYYLLIAEGGTDELHRASIARSKSPSGPFEPCPHNPLMYNGQGGAKNLTVQSTGHATFVEAADGKWFASFIARRNVNGSSPLGRETFLAAVTWENDWPIINNGNPILLSEEVGPKTGPKNTPAAWMDDFSGKELDPSWYQLRTPYVKSYDIYNGRLAFKPNVFGLSDRDHPAAVLRKQTSLNMKFSAELLGFEGLLGQRMRVGVASYLSEFQHQDVGVKGCDGVGGVCLFTEVRRNGTADYWQRPLNSSSLLKGGLKFHIRAEPLAYHLGYSFGNDEPTYVTEIESKWQAFAPTAFYVFTGASFALFATGEGEPWPVDGPKVGFTRVEERYYEEEIGDYDRW